MQLFVLILFGLGTMLFIGVSNILSATRSFFRPTTYSINEWLVEVLKRKGLTERMARGIIPVIEALSALVIIAIILN